MLLSKAPPSSCPSSTGGLEVAENQKSWALLALVTTLRGLPRSPPPRQVTIFPCARCAEEEAGAVMKTMLASGPGLAGRSHGRLRVPRKTRSPEATRAATARRRLDHVVKAKSRSRKTLLQEVRPVRRRPPRQGRDRQVFSRLGEDPPPAALDAIFDELDHDKNGTIDFDEFVTGIWSHAAPTVARVEGAEPSASAIKRSGSCG